MDHPGDSPTLRLPKRPRRSPGELATRFAKRGSAALVKLANGGVADVRARLMRPVAARRLRAVAEPLRLCLGSGHAPLEGWVNIDFEPPADVLVDLRYGLPVRDASVSAIYSEHLVEHLPLEAGLAMFRDWRRVITPTGVVRIATPDLAMLITDYRGDWRSRHEWITWPEHAHIDTAVRMINVAMREWGHAYLYDFEELALRLHDAGFSDVRRVEIGESADPELRGLETRADSSLVVEARP
jgi:predicted SAM-dependent methyltransferase